MRVRNTGPFVVELNKHLCSLKDSSSRKDNRFVQNPTPDLTMQICSILQRLVDTISLLLSQSHADVIVKGICCLFEGRNTSNPSTKRQSNKNGQFLVAYHYRGDHLCFQGNKSVIWILEAFKMGIASYRGRNCRPLARELVRYWYSLRVSHTLHLASEHKSWKKALRARMKQIHLHFFLWQPELAGEIGGCLPWRLGCSAIYWWPTPGGMQRHR